MALIHNNTYKVTVEMDEMNKETDPISPKNQNENKAQTNETDPESLKKQNENKVQTIEGQQQMSAISNQLFNFGLMGNTVSDMVQTFELEGKNAHFRPKTIVVLNLYGISLICQSLLLWFTLWRYLYIRSRGEGGENNGCCGDERCQCCNCCRGTADVLFTICFILTTVVMGLQIIAGVVGSIQLVPNN